MIFVVSLYFTFFVWGKYKAEYAETKHHAGHDYFFLEIRMAENTVAISRDSTELTRRIM
jgi:hypothetical protein